MHFDQQVERGRLVSGNERVSDKEMTFIVIDSHHSSLSIMTRKKSSFQQDSHDMWNGAMQRKTRMFTATSCLSLPWS